MGSSQDLPHEDKYAEIVDGLKTNKFSNITFITGAGISTGAGIPDFRSRGGCFEQVRIKYNMSQPEDLFEINSFIQNPYPFYDFCKGFNIENCKPTKSHLFMGFLCKKNIVRKIYTQNVDGLELKAGIPEDKIVFAHGKITEAACPRCGKYYDINLLRDEYVMKDKILYCERCNKVPIKPIVIFYGQSLPISFFLSFFGVYFSDLSFIMGTSLKVYPFSGLVYKLPKNSWRILINKEKAGDKYEDNRLDFDNKCKKDLFLEGNADDVIMKLVKDVGWEDEFNSYCQEMLSKLK